MAVFPESNPTPVYPLDVTPVYDTLVSPMDSRAEQRRQKTLFPVYDVTVNYDSLTNAEADTIWRFFMARRGAAEAFYIYDLSLLAAAAFTHETQWVGSGDGASAVFDLPGRSTSAQAIYVAGSVVDPANYSILTGGGEGNADRVQFAAGAEPASGAMIWADFTGFLRMRVRFADDRLPRTLFLRNLFRYGLKLKGVSEYAS